MREIKDYKIEKDFDRRIEIEEEREKEEGRGKGDIEKKGRKRYHKLEGEVEFSIV